jgi:hypothetical protein
MSVCRAELTGPSMPASPGARVAPCGIDAEAAVVSAQTNWRPPRLGRTYIEVL